MNVTKVSFGVTSIIGYLTAALAAIPIVIQALEEGLVAFRTSGWLGVFVVVTTAVTTLVRGLQAAAKAHAAAGKTSTHPETR